MKLPLTVKISLLLVANLLLLVGLGAGWFLLRGETGWQTIATGPLSDRVQVIVDGIVRELWEEPPATRDALLARHAATHRVEFLWVRNDGLVFAGPSLPLPAAVSRELSRPGRRGPERPALGGPEDEAPGPGPRNPRRSGLGRFLVHAPDGTYWFGFRGQPSADDLARTGRPSPPTTLLIHIGSSWRLASLLGLPAWASVPAIAMGVSILFWLPFAQSISRRLRRLTAVTQHIAEGRFETRTGLRGHDELGRLSESVDAMAARLDTLVNGQKRFLGDVAHELGSPIARLQVAVEILEQQSPTADDPRLADVREEVQQMSALVNELLAFTEAGLQARPARLEPLALAPLLAGVLAQEGATTRVTCQGPADLTVNAEPRLLARALGNLVRNALRHAGADAPITVTTRQAGEHVFITVADEGPGVPPAALASLGEPFFRPEAARTRESGGVGLGLSIVKGSIAACAGQVTFRNRTPHGFEAEIRLGHDA